MPDGSNAFRDLTARFLGARGLGRFRAARSEKLAEMATLSWRDFWRDLGFRFLIAGAVVAVVAVTVAIVRLFAR
jgi:hypothetical protein